MTDTELIFSRVFKRHYLPKLTTQEILDELKSRDGVTTRNEGLCYIESGCQYEDYEDCAVCIKEHPVTTIVVKK